MRIAEVRRQLGLTQADLAARVGVSLRALDRYETGTVEPTPEVLGRIAEVTGVPVARLSDTGGHGEPGAEHAHLVERISDAVGESATSSSARASSADRPV